MEGVSTEIDAEPPNHYICPITHDLMGDPVAASDGHICERRIATTTTTTTSLFPSPPPMSLFVAVPKEIHRA